jgi:gamma-glutamylcyclotransferase (GGCT)/AIG2-like uncharacterized protein YtfP
MGELVFFYGTLMAGFDRRRRAGIDSKLTYVGRGAIRAALFDLGIYPAAVPAPESLVWGELYEMVDSDTVLADVRLSDETVVPAWVYFYNAPLGRASRIASGDYLEHVKVR